MEVTIWLDSDDAANQILPSRDDNRLVRFETWLDKRIQSFAGNPHIQQPFEQF